MGRQILLSEEDKKNIQEMYGLINEKKEKYIIKKVMVDKYMDSGNELRYEVLKVKRNILGRDTYKPLTYISDGDWGIPAEIMNHPPFRDIESAKSAIESDANGEYEIYIQD